MESESHHATQATAMFMEILDSLIVDVAAEAHRAARLGFDYRLNMDEEEEQRLSSEARGVIGETGTSGGNKYVVDVFGQTHPVIASQLLECINCNRSIAAGRFASHLEKCMGKGRKARSAAIRNISSAVQQRRPRVANNNINNSNINNSRNDSDE